MRFVSLAAPAGGLFALALLASGVTSAALADSGRSQIGFVARQSEVDLTGTFHQFSADIQIDPARPQDGKVKVSIDTASEDAGGADADNLIKSKEFFDIAHFPSATFEASSISAGTDGRFLASGPFTLKGHSANIVIPFTTHSDASGTWYEGSTKISRLAFGVGQGQWSDTSTLDDEVLIQFKLRVAR
jgi:polyisoprenoid-binding protein YceI